MTGILNCDFHLHSNLDPIDGKSGKQVVKESFEQMIDAAKQQKIDVLAFTHHTQVIYTKEMVNYAKKQGILLIKGIEADIEGAHVLILNPKGTQFSTFSDVENERKRNKECLIIAPHPYYPAACSLHNKLEENIALFDAIEFCHMHLKWCTWFNDKALQVAKKHNRAIIGTSDAHRSLQIGWTYTQIFAKKDWKSVRKAILEKKTLVFTQSVPYSYLLRILLSVTRLSKWLKFA